MRLLNLNPNELVLAQRSGRSHLTVIRTHIFESPPFQCCGNNKIQARQRQLVFRLVARSNSPDCSRS